MKPTMALKPLVFALAALMAVAAQADSNRHPTPTPAATSGASAVIADVQVSHDNNITNNGTLNSAKVTDSVKNTNGNVGVNVASGSGNQQDNAAAIASSDQNFVLGTAAAVVSASQTNSYNKVNNHGTQNGATLNDSIRNTSGNIGVNVSAGDLNQQKNNLAIAVSGGNLASAAAGTVQTSNNLTVVNDLSSVSTHTPWHNPNTARVAVSNNSTVNDSIKYTSGNVGANVSAGVGNQQNNSMVISTTSM
ncbi:hypothetical protein SAMN04490192_2549 [Pseudomonas lundensis]|jgi:hypothetical protein|uniref:hypothetical protein n=1 Tax=Pseudomonas lundensis TaxID=86185 RepID=UPI00088196DD|nr:hypothetical protein [Pseudomonas lundensis]MBM1181543.1 heme utilization protein [Pseudomonas lundensis]NNA24691.1 hypothetical protein [Pseudomonas lundensis]SDQ66929.1 hypothetical protein SAMN04490192_2549 [Pseudomonas lundensis]